MRVSRKQRVVVTKKSFNTTKLRLSDRFEQAVSGLAGLTQLKMMFHKHRNDRPTNVSSIPHRGCFKFLNHQPKNSDCELSREVQISISFVVLNDKTSVE